MVRRYQRILAMLTVFAMLFCDIAVPSFADDPVREPVCGRTEHTHSAECYKTVTICGQEESDPRTEWTFTGHFETHTHGPECTDEAGNLICGIYAGKYIHTHNDYCYDEAGNLVCGLEERLPHEHTDDCWEEQQVLICEREENEEHTHDESCYETFRVLTCDLDHHHTSVCYDESGKLTCGEGEIPEFICSENDWTETVVSEGHHHTDACYSQELDCGLEEHTHTEDCYPAPAAEQQETEPEAETETEPKDEPKTEPDENPAEEPDEKPAETSEDNPANGNTDETGVLTEENPGEENDQNPDENNTESVPEEAAPEEPAGESPDETTGDAPENPTEQQTEDTTDETPENTTEDTTDETTEDPDETGEEEDSDNSAGEEGEASTGASAEYSEPQNGQSEPAEPEASGDPEDPEEPEEPIDEETARLIESYLQQRETGKSAEDGTPEEDSETGETAEEKPEDPDAAQAGEADDRATEAPDQETNEDDAEKSAETEMDPDDETAENPDEALAGNPEKEITEAQNGVPAEAPDEEPEEEIVEEPEEEAEEEPAEVTIPSTEDAPYAVTVTFSSDAGVPEGTTLVVTEAGTDTEIDAVTEEGIQEEAPLLRKAAGKSANLMRMAKSASAAEAEPHAELPSLTTWDASGEAPEILLYDKTLDISLLADGVEIEPDPEARVTVTVVLPGVVDGQEIEVRHLTEEGSELLESTNEAGTVTFTTSSFSRFSFTSRARELCSWTSDFLENTFFGKTTTQETAYEGISAENDIEGLEILEAFEVTPGEDLWMMLQRIRELTLGKLESVALYTVENGRLGQIVKDHLSLTDVLRFSLSDLSSFALVKDSGLRRKTEELGSLTLSGMLPKNAEVDAADVTEAFEDFSTLEKTIAAYDIAITTNGEEYQPEDHPVTVIIQDEAIRKAAEQGSTLTLWHVVDENNREEITDFTVDYDTVTFSASGFSAYVITEIVVTRALENGDQVNYLITAEFDTAAGIPANAELAVTPIDPSSEIYNSYREATAKALGKQDAQLTFAHAFDIALVDPETGEHYQPDKNVRVKVQLLTETLEENQSIRVVHFAEDNLSSGENLTDIQAAEETQAAGEASGGEEVAGEETNSAESFGTAEILPASVLDGTVAFETGSFSVFVITNTIETVYQTAEGESYRITVEYGDEAELPAGTELRVAEAEASKYAQQTAAILNTTEEYLLYRKFLDISFVTKDENGNEIILEPKAPVNVKIELLDVTAGADKLQVVHFGTEGAGKVEAAATEEAVITFSSSEFSVFGIGNVLETLATTETEMASVKILGFTGDTSLTATNAPVMEEGVEVLGAYTLVPETKEETESETKEASDNTHSPLWIKAELKDGAALTETESVMIYTIEDKTTEEMTEKKAAELAETGTVAELKATEFAIVKDTGFRRLSIELNMKDGQASSKEAETKQDEPVERQAATDGEADEIAEETRIINLQGMMPKEAAATAVDVTEFFADHEYPVQEEKSDVSEEEEQAEEDSGEITEEDTDSRRITLAAYDITVLNNEIEYQPSTERPIQVEILDNRITGGEYIELWHIKGDGTEEQVADFAAEAGKITFRATGFSAYAIVQGPDPVNQNDIDVEDLEELAQKWNDPSTGGKGFYLSLNNKSIYVSNTVKNGNNGGTVFAEVTRAQAQLNENCIWYFIKEDNTNTTDSNKYYIYTKVEDEPKYIHQTSGNNIELSDAKTAFDLSEAASRLFYLQLESENKWLQHSGGGGGVRFWQDKNNAANSQFTFTYVSSTTLGDDPYSLDGKTYGLMFWNGGVAGKALMAEDNGSGSLKAKPMEVLVKSDDIEDKLFVPNDSDITLWTFHWISDDQYYLTTNLDGAEKYLKITGSSLSIANDEQNASRIQAVPGTGDHAGEICLKTKEGTLTYSGNAKTGFNTGGSAGKEWLHFVAYSDLTADYFLTYTAAKVSVSDPAITNGSKIIVYTRFWNETRKRYDFYAIDSDGVLFPCYESGDTIQWIGNRINKLLWNFVEYYDDEGKANYYYDLYNEYSEKYIVPKLNGDQILSSNPIGINLDGRKKGYFYSSIMAWDDPNYAYACLKVENGAIATCRIADAFDFYFAIMQDVQVDDEMSDVRTVDHEAHGITMKIKDFGSRKEMSDFLGSNAGGMGTALQQGLLSTNLNANGYPTTKAGNNLGELFGGGRRVNHLFIEGTYNGSGYFTYDSTQNFATLQDDNTFKVYRELGTFDDTSGTTRKHGQFAPFNDIEPGVFSSLHKNLRTATNEMLPDTDPRKNENLYLVKNPDWHFGVELEASFVQTPSGHDAWGHDIIYEFTGDDDFWLYVDGELIIDLGGIHSAVPGNVNYCTGEVNVNGKQTTIYKLFKSNYEKRGLTQGQITNLLEEKFEQQFDKNGNPLKTPSGDNVFRFKDYTTHTMRIFYMERGAGASNLNMRFNLASVEPGHIELSKDVSGVEDKKTLLAEYPFQIFYKQAEGEPEHQLTQGENELDIRVVYKDTTTPVKFKSAHTAGGITYSNVFMLRPGETADIDVPDEGIYYRVVECGVNTSVYEAVLINEGTITPSKYSNETYQNNRVDYQVKYEKTSNRPRLAFLNVVNPDAMRTLTIKKVLYDETGVHIIDDPKASFSFRLYFNTEGNTNYTLADKYTYHIRNKEGYYCKWDAGSQKFVSTGVADYTTFTDEEKQEVSFKTSINGSMSKIPASYSVEIREILVGTMFEVEERNYEIPDGYSLSRYELYNSESPGTGNPIVFTAPVPATGDIESGKDALVNICNLKGYGLRMYKTWTDADYMSQRAATYFAVFTQNGTTLTLVPKTVKQLLQNESTLYWYFEKLNGIPFVNYVLREVTITETDPEIVNGVILNPGTVTPVDEGGTLSVSGVQKGEGSPTMKQYQVHYEQGVLEDADSNVRIDQVTNTRPGIILKKTDWSGDGLNETMFTLQDLNYDADDPEKSKLLYKTYTSDNEGYITTAFLNKNATYILTETKAKPGYHGLQTPVTIHTDANGRVVNVSGLDENQYTLASADQTTDNFNQILTIKNKLYTFSVRKQDSVTGELLAKAHFSLHRQRTVGGVTMVDFAPMPGYEDLISGNDGVIPGLDQTLPPDTYELRETQAPPGYQKLPSGILFKLSDLGAITLLRAPEGTELLPLEVDQDGEICVIYTLKISNGADEKWPWLKLSKKVEGGMYNPAAEYLFTVTIEDLEGEFEISGDITGSVTFVNGKTTVSLAHGQSVIIAKLPPDSLITITEETENYTTTWKVDGHSRDAVNNAISIDFTDSTSVEVTNHLPYAAPTGLSIRYAPFLLLLLFGVILLISGNSRKDQTHKESLDTGWYDSEVTRAREKCRDCDTRSASDMPATDSKVQRRGDDG